MQMKHIIITVTLLFAVQVIAQNNEYRIIFAMPDGFYANNGNAGDFERLWVSDTVGDHTFSPFADEIIFQDENGIWFSDLAEWHPRLILPTESNRTVGVNWLPNRFTLLKLLVFAQKMEDFGKVEKTYLFDSKSGTLDEWAWGNCDSIARGADVGLVTVCHVEDETSDLTPQSVVLLDDGTYQPYVEENYEMLINDYYYMGRSDWGSINSKQHLIFPQYTSTGELGIFQVIANGDIEQIVTPSLYEGGA